MNMFEIAARKKFRFSSTRGELTTEQLLDAPLRSKDGFDLNAIAKAANAALKEVSEESFVETTKSPATAALELKLEIVKYVIQSKLDEEAAAKDRAARKIEKDKLVEILASKKNEALLGLSEKEIQRRIAELSE